MLRLAILNGETIDERDPKVYEGLLIDKQSRDFLKLKYVRLTPYDFDELYKGINNFEYLANETKKILLKDNFILFQPVFIYKNKAVTRPDVLIKEKGKYTIIEVKGTTKPKIKHLVDMIYQHHVINNVLSEFNESIFDYLLCVVKYTKGTRNKIEFIINEHIPLVKDGKDLSDKAKLQFPGLLKYSDQAIEARCLARLDNDSSVTIQKLIQLDSSGLENKKKKLYDARVVPLLDEEEFEKIIDELQAFTPTGEPTLLPDISHFAT
jgi:DNA-directed RNA polymerase specialized sigma54-like protein